MADTFTSIRGKRATVKLPALKEKARRGRFTSSDRALVRVGNLNTRILVGLEDLSTWDDEELRRGRKRNADGRFLGRDPVVVPKVVHDEMVRRTMAHAGRLLQDNLVSAVKVLTDILKDPEVDAKERLKAVDMVMNRVMGKDPQKVEISGDAKWQVAISGGIKSLKSFKDLEDPHAGNRDTGDEELEDN